MKNKSVAKNAFLNTIKTFMSLVFPLITFPYISRILLVDNLGKVNFCSSIIEYFSIFALLGTRTYATREGAKYRDDPIAFNNFANEIFSFTIITTFISYLVLFLLIFFVSSLNSYIYLLLILSVSIIFNTLGTEWICSVFEDYGYITLRTIAFQIISIVLMFVFVHNINDYYVYAWILVFSSSGANILNYFYIKKYTNLNFTFKVNLKKHFLPIIVLFASTLATSIYVSSDTTILGFISGDYYTGLYSVSSKIYSIGKRVISAVLLVSIPRFSYYYGKNMIDSYNDLFEKICKTLYLLIFPLSIGLFILSKNVVLFIAGGDFLLSTNSLRILSLAIIPVGISWLLSQCVLIPMKQEKYVLYVTVFTVFVNVILNILLVPYFNHFATAFTTLLAEFIVALLYIIKVYKKISFKSTFKTLYNVLISCFFMIIVVLISHFCISNYLLDLLISSLLGFCFYFLSLYLLHDKTFLILLNKFINVFNKLFHFKIKNSADL